MKYVDGNTFDDAVADAKVAIIDFYANWCGPCRQMEPSLQQLENDGAATVIKVDIDQNQELAVRFGIKSIPTLMLSIDGDIIDTKIGSHSINSLRTWLETNI